MAAWVATNPAPSTLLALGPVGKALYSGLRVSSVPSANWRAVPAPRGGQDTLPVRGRGMSAHPPAPVGCSRISAAQKTLAILCGALGTVTGCQTQSMYPLDDSRCLAEPIGELGTLPSIKRHFTAKGRHSR